MKTMKHTEHASSDNNQFKEVEKGSPKNAEIAFAELELGVYAALETYSNVHRGSGHNSLVSSQLYDKARDIVLKYLGLNKDKYTVIFCTPKRAADLMAHLEPKSYQCVSSHDLGLPLGLWALAVMTKALPKGAPSQRGGGTARLVAKSWLIWNDSPDKFEAGTPAIMNVITFTKALLLIQQYGKDIFKHLTTANQTANEILYNDELEKYSGRELLDKLRQTLIGRGFIVPTMEGAKPFINLDNSASTPTFSPIWKTFREALRLPEQRKQEIISEVKTICSKILGAPLEAYDVIFTTNTTEAINLASESLSRESEKDVEPVVLISLLEHSSNDLPWRMASKSSLIRLTVDAEGFVDLNELETLLSAYNQKNQYGKKRIKLVALSGASNVLGTCNNIEEISPIVHRYGARFLVDGAQIVAHRKVEIEKYGIDYLPFSAHKVYAPFGTGVLVVKKGLLNYSSTELKQIQLSGEENIGGIAALGKALVLLQRIGLDVVHEEEQVLTRQALRGMSQIPGLKIFGIKEDSPRFDKKIGVIAFETKGVLHNKLAKELFQKGGVGVRYGCHCSHLLVKHLIGISPILEQVQRIVLTVAPQTQLPGVVRVSLGLENTENDIDTLIQVLGKIVQQSKGKVDGQHNGSPVMSEADFQQQMNDFSKAAARRVYAQPE